MCVSADFARQLETELTAALARVGELMDDWENGRVAIQSLTRQLSESQAQLEKQRLILVANQKIMDGAGDTIRALQTQLTSAREDVLRMDKAEELCSEFDCTSDATDFFLILPKSRDNEHGPKIFNPTLRSAIDAARGVPEKKLPVSTGRCYDSVADMIKGEGLELVTETPAGGEAGKYAWQDIATAPKDGTSFLLYWPFWRDHAVLGRWNVAMNTWDAECRLHDTGPLPTHWQPLPPPPTGKDQK